MARLQIILPNRLLAAGCNALLMDEEHQPALRGWLPRAGEIGRERGSGRWRWRPATWGSPEEERSRVCGGGLAASASVVDPVQRW
jgi:hypothetical protein